MLSPCPVLIHIVPVYNGPITAAKAPVVLFNKCEEFINKVIPGNLFRNGDTSLNFNLFDQ